MLLKIIVNDISIIYKESMSYLSKDINGNIKCRNQMLFAINIFPLLLATALLLSDIYLNDIIIGYLMSFISVFAGLFFILIFIVSDKYNNKKGLKRYENSGKLDEENILYLERYKIFAKKFVTQISYMVLVSIVLMFLFIVISKFISAENLISVDYVKYLVGGDYMGFVLSRLSVLRAFNVIVHSCVYFLLVQYMIILLVLICNLHRMIIHDIE